MDWPSTWTIIKASGLTSFVLLFISVSFGALRSLLWVPSKWRNGMLMIHQSTGWLGFLIGLLHGLVLTADTYFDFTITSILVPFTSPYRPIASGLGTIALYMLFIVLVTSDIMKWMGRKYWKRVHFIVYPMYLLSLFHGLFAGYDSTKEWAQYLYFGSLLATLLIIGVRFFPGRVKINP